jgi:hypothetical protein
MWKNIVQSTDDNIIRRLRFACRLSKANNTHSGYVIVIVVSYTATMVTRTRHGVTLYVTLHILFSLLPIVYTKERKQHLKCVFYLRFEAFTTMKIEIVLLVTPMKFRR